LELSVNFELLSNSFEIHQFWIRNTKAKLKIKKVHIAGA
jgi:hypothetical protein